MSVVSPLGVYIAEIPFIGADNGKLRPVIVISEPQGQYKLVVVVPISSQPKREAADLSLKEWQAAGLIKPSVARVHRLTTLMQSDLKTELGHISALDARMLRKALSNLLQLTK
jgi:mRNA-degrading endonuclease toxin of MazEF toxin-antitoxin module